MVQKIAFTASSHEDAQIALTDLVKTYGNAPEAEADVIVALGGDGFMLHTLHRTQDISTPVYGMNRGTVGFLMNEFDQRDLKDRLAAATEEVVNPLSMRAKCTDVLALTAVAAFRPRRWRGALLPKNATVRFDVLDPEKRPVMADADSRWVENVHWVEIQSEPKVAHRILFDPGHGLEERLIREQFV